MDNRQKKTNTVYINQNKKMEFPLAVSGHHVPSPVPETDRVTLIHIRRFVSPFIHKNVHKKEREQRKHWMNISFVCGHSPTLNHQQQ